MASIPPIRFARVGEVSLAFQVFGTGDRDVVVIPPMAHNIELMWERPEFRRIFDRMGRYARVVHFDKRGTGMSDRTARVPTMDERVEDTRAVMDAAEVARCFMYGLSEGGPMAVLFAVTYPERLLGLVLHATAPVFAPPDESSEEASFRRAAKDHWLDRWGTEATTTLQLLAPTAASDPSYRAWQPRFERHSASPAAMRELVDMWEDIDVREALASISVPTLVLHRRDDVAMPADAARNMAAAIPGAEFVELDGADHYAHIGDVDQWLELVETFVTGIAAPTPQPHTRPQVTTAEIHTFGGFRVTRNGVDVALTEWGSRQARLMCKRLAAAAGEPVPRDVLTELLWPDEPNPSKLGARLSVQLSKVRHVLGGGVIADRDAIRLDLDAVSLDLAQLHAAITTRRADQIVTIHGGPFLPEHIYEPWTESPRERARTAYIDALAELANDASSRHDHTIAIDLAQRPLDADPYNTSAHQRLIDALHASGRHGDAHHARQRRAARMNELDDDDN